MFYNHTNIINAVYEDRCLLLFDATTEQILMKLKCVITYTPEKQFKNVIYVGY